MRIQIEVKVISLTVIDHAGEIHNTLHLTQEDAAEELAAYLNHEPEALDIKDLKAVQQAAGDSGLHFDIYTEVLDYDTHP